MVNCGSLIAEVNDVVDTGSNGYKFIKLNTGMDAVTWPSLYGSWHPIIVLNRVKEAEEIINYAVVGHCCETGDLFT